MPCSFHHFFSFLIQGCMDSVKCLALISVYCMFSLVTFVLYEGITSYSYSYNDFILPDDYFLNSALNKDAKFKSKENSKSFGYIILEII